MKTLNITWEFPTHQSNTTCCDYIKWNAKIHAFDENGDSLCEKHRQSKGAFETYDLDRHIQKYGEKAICPKCYKKYLKEVAE